ncbi:MAG: flagellar hook-basal body complex protein, partial [Microbacteriaceae bacterium]|nr:flagellar hook-basal body complex protein [Microbacteriaceae bacterium]
MPVASPEQYLEMLDRAKNHGFAYPAINVSSSQTLNAALAGLEAAGSDGIIQVTTGGGDYWSGPTVKNMASGAIPPHSTRPATIFDAQGTGHNINMSFLKTATNTWAVEVYAVPASDVTSSLPNGQIAYGTLIFNGDGTLRSVSTGLSSETTIQWTNGASSSGVTFDWGTAGQPAGTANATIIGLADGMSQQSADYSLNFINQNGAPVGQLSGVSIDRAGFITASYSNGETQRLFKIPLTSFTNPDQLQSVSGNSYTQTSESGEVNLKQADTSGVGFISSSALEASNVELANQLTDMIVAQRAYQANTKVIS